MQGGFSIREYASRMRSINVVNCWPFDESFSEETVKSLLPPITVKKFTWWLDELEHTHSKFAENFKISEKKKKKKIEKGETSSRDQDQGMEECDNYAKQGMEVEKLKSLKGKMKAPKKRSIVEIFAVAPPVERVISEEEEEEEEDEDSVEEDASLNSNSSRVEINCNLKGKNQEKKKKKKNTDVILRKALRVVKKIKKKKAQKQVDENKENCPQLKLPAQDKATGHPSSSCNTELENDILDHVSTLKRKPRLQHLDAYKKTAPCKALKLMEENQHPGLPGRGILENHGEAFSLEQSTECILEEAVQVNHSNAQKANKHVTFSKEDEILRLSRKPSHIIECLKLQKVCGSDVGSIVDHAGGAEKDSTNLGATESEEASIRIRKEVGAVPASNEQLTTCTADSTTFMMQKHEQHSGRPEASERSSLHDMNQRWSDSGLRDAPHNSLDACPPRFFCMPLDGCYKNPNIQVIRNSSNSTCRRLDKDLGTPGPIFPPLRFKDYPRTYNEDSVPHLSNTEKRTYRLPQTSLESTGVNNANSFQFQTFPNLSPKELVHTFSYPPAGSQTGSTCGRRNINGINEDFVGLPLNSQGELITLNSSARRDVNQMMNSIASAAHSNGLSLPSNAVSKCLGHHSESRSLDCRTSSMNQLNLFPVDCCVKENPIAVVPSRLGVTKPQSESKANLDLHFVEMSYHSYHDAENTMCKGDNQVQKCLGNEKNQSTMRLMGKEFEVGERDIERFEDGHIWKDKQIIDELHFGNSSISNVVHDQNEPSLGILRENLFCPSESMMNDRSESKYALHHFDLQTTAMYQSVYVARKIDPVQRLYPSLSPGTFSEVYNSESLFYKPFTSGYESQLFTFELPTPTAAYQDLYPNMSPSAIQLKNKQNLQHTPISAIRFPFMHPDLDRHAKSSWSQRSSVNRPPLSFDISKKATQLSNSQSCNLGCHHPYLNAGSSHGNISSVSHKPGDFCTFSPLPSGLALQSSVAPAPLAPMPYYPGVLPASAMPKRHGNQKKFKERIKSRIGIRGLDNGKKSKGQLSALANVPFKPLKMPTFGFREGSQCAIRKPTACVSFDGSVENIEGGFESCSASNKSKFVMCGEYGTNYKDEKIISPRMDSYFDAARTGPVKLTAGGKHILKACQQKDQSSSTSTDQDISLSPTTIGLRFSEFENSAKIYRFSGKASVLEL